MKTKTSFYFSFTLLSLVSLMTGYFLYFSRINFRTGKYWSFDIIPIRYGLPSQKTMTKAEMGKVQLGGCVREKHAPNWIINIQYPKNDDSI